MEKLTRMCSIKLRRRVEIGTTNKIVFISFLFCSLSCNWKKKQRIGIGSAETLDLLNMYKLKKKISNIAFHLLVEMETEESKNSHNELPDVIPVTSAILTSAAFYIGQACQNTHSEFMLCKHERGQNPAHCVEEGWKVTECVYNLLRDFKKHCDSEFSQHWKCLDFNNQEFRYCRQQETQLNSCVLKNLNLERKIEVPVPDVIGP
jgi:NADH dehydrogenase (ubiquinone) 1 alpha subcomplex subunit 8